MKRLMSAIMGRRIASGNANSSKLTRLYTRDQVARLGDVCTRTVARDEREGRIEAIRFNRRRIRYTEEAVRRYLSGEYADSTDIKPALSVRGSAETGGNKHLDGDVNNDAPPNQLHEAQKGAQREANLPKTPQKTIKTTKKGTSAAYNSVCAYSLKMPEFWLN